MSSVRAAGWRLRTLPNPGPVQSSADVWLPDLANSGAGDLVLIAGIGSHRAQRLILERARLGFPLTAQSLHLMRGFSRETAVEVAAWYAGGGSLVE